MSTIDAIDLINFVLMAILIGINFIIKRRAERAEAVAEMWKRMAQKRTDRIANGLED